MTAGRFRLYGRPGSGSAPVEALLAMGGFSHEVIDVPKDQESSDYKELCRLNALAQVPTLLLPDGTVMTESAAILLDLADRKPELSLCPPPGSGSDRALYLRMMVFLAANQYMTFLEVYYPDRYASDAAGAAQVRAAALARNAGNWEAFAGIYPEGWAGQPPGALELYLSILMDWDDDPVALARKHPHLGSATARVFDHPIAASIWQRHGVRRIA